MVRISYTIVLSALVLVHQVQSFCVYNEFTDKTSIEVTQTIRSTPVSRRFRKNIEAGGNECCHYRTQDCSPRQVDADPTSFYVFFHWSRYNSERHSVACTTGGALTFKGDEGDHWAECTDRWGITTQVPIIPDAQRS